MGYIYKIDFSIFILIKYKLGKRAIRRLRRKLLREQRRYLKKTTYHNLFHETQKNMDYIFNGLTTMDITDKNFKILGKPSSGNLSQIPSLTL
jgi:transcription initiation factor IIE alpha subunit